MRRLTSPWGMETESSNNRCGRSRDAPVRARRHRRSFFGVRTTTDEYAGRPGQVMPPDGTWAELPSPHSFRRFPPARMRDSRPLGWPAPSLAPASRGPQGPSSASTAKGDQGPGTSHSRLGEGRKALCFGHHRRTQINRLEAACIGVFKHGLDPVTPGGTTWQGVQ
jgi:hypothetical protein